MHASGSDVFVANTQVREYDALFKKINSSFNALYSFKKIASLKNLGKLSSLVRTKSALSRNLQLGGGSVQYNIRHGVVMCIS